MPLTFPSHQGLVLPLARTRPEWFEPLALCIGAAMPDVVDGIIGVGAGHLGRGYGHSLVGLIALCLPGGLLLTWMTAALWECAALRSPRIVRLQAATAKLWPRRTAAAAGSAGGARSSHGPRDGRLVTASASILLGAFSHLVFDFISHGGFKWLYPWYESIDCFPAWWHTKWFGMDLPWFEEPYPFAPHTVVWCVLTILGAWLFVRPLCRRPETDERRRAHDS